MQIHVRAGEDVLLLENSDPHMWKIRNGRNQESHVPATIVLIRGPCADAIDSAARFIAYSILKAFMHLKALLFHVAYV